MPVAILWVDRYCHHLDRDDRRREASTRVGCANERRVPEAASSLDKRVVVGNARHPPATAKLSASGILTSTGSLTLRLVAGNDNHPAAAADRARQAF
jgi:hypothetical protein